jgi:tetratricopeptide (TPR) repeat protein
MDDAKAAGEPDLFRNPRLYLTTHPDDSNARVVYRTNQRRGFKGREAEHIKKSSSRVGARLALGVKGNPLEVIEACEEHLEKNPFDIMYLFKLGEAAQTLGYYDTAIATFNDVIVLCSKVKGYENQKKDAMRSLGLTYHAAKRYEDAKKVFDRFRKVYRLDDESREIRDLVERDLDATIASKVYEQGGGAHKLVRDDREVERLRGAREGLRSEEEILAGIDSLEDALGDNSKSSTERLSAATKASELYLRLRRYDDAISTREKGKVFDTGHDSELAVAELKVKKANYEISELEKQVEERGSDELESKLDDAKKRKWEFIVGEYGNLVSKIPTGREDLYLTLGEGYFHLGKLEGDNERIKLAISQFQRQYNKKELKSRAAIMLGRSFSELGVFKLAIKQFKTILESMEKDNPAEKEIAFEALYELAHVLEQTGDIEGAADTIGEIYWRDRSWRDTEEILLRLNEVLSKEQ